MNYFKKWTPTRRWRTILAIGVPAIGLLWLAGMAVTRNNIVYSSGPLSSAHAVLSNQCNTCHQPILVGVGFRKHVRDQSCLSCHEAPPHQANQTFTPSCASCHVEHVGSTNLAHAADRSCTQCHSDLQVKGAPHLYQTAITRFNTNHPQFAVLRAGYRDPGTIKFNHSAHLKAGLLDGSERPVQLECSDCHRSPSGQQQAWKYGEAAVKTQSEDAGITRGRTSGAGDPHAPTMMPLRNGEEAAEPARPGAGRAYMRPPTYANNCAGCHSLQYDPAIDQPAPHDRPEMVHAFIVQELTDYISAHPSAIRETAPSELMIPRGAVNRETARSSGEWIKLHTRQAEDLFWRKTCVQCHALTFASTESGTLPEVAPSKITARWLPHAVFDHYAHASLTCESCHVKARTSQETSDVLVPGIETCQSCHRDAQKAASADNSCALCHQYHDWQQAKPIKGKYSIPQLVGRAGSAPTPDHNF